jgi:hypothetical protein
MRKVTSLLFVFLMVAMNLLGQAPVNDLCADAIPIDCATGTIFGTTIDATPDVAPFCGTSTTSPGVWYKFTTNASALVTLSLCNTSPSWDTKLTVFEDGCLILTCVAGNDDFPGCNLMSQVSFDAVPGTDYLVLVHGFSANTGDFQLDIDCLFDDPVCLNAPNGQYPSGTFTPAVCDGTPEVIISDAYTGEYSIIAVTMGNVYEFSSSEPTDYITIANTALTEAFAVGTTPVTWTADFSGNIAFLRHLDDDCTFSSAIRAVSVSCELPPPPDFCLVAIYGLYPSATFTNSVCDGTLELINSFAWASEYSNVTVIDGNTYTFQSSNINDYITISNADGTEGFVAGTTPVTFVADFDGVVRFYRHTNDQCGSADVSRSVSVSCMAPPPPFCLDAIYGLWPTATFTSTVCDGTLETVSPIAWTGEYSNVSVVEGNTYEFVSSVATDFITIANEAGTEPIIAATTPVVWEADFTGVVRFYRHLDDECSFEVGSRTIQVGCQEPPPGDDCSNPIIVDAFPYFDFGQTTCGRGNNYSNTCLGSYDGGEDIIYQFTLTEELIVTITMDPKSTTWTGILLSDECPGETCIAFVTGSAAAPKVIEELLAPGTYYIMVDTYPSPDCIPVFDLTIEAVSPIPPGFIAGVVSDPNGDPLEGVEVMAGAEVTFTDVNGEYEFEIELGFYDLTFLLEYYETQLFADVEVVPELTTTLDVTMPFAPQPDCPILVFPTASTGVLPNATLEWALPAGSAPALGYKILLYDITADLWIEGDPNTFEGSDIGNTTTYVPAENFEFGHQYSWMITPYNFSGGPEFCTPWSFQVAFGGGITGVVTDNESGLPIEGATVLIEQTLPNNLVTNVITDENGEYDFEWETGNYKMTFSKYGYADQVFNNVTINLNQTTVRNAALTPFVPYEIPFTETWNSGAFATQQWSTVPTTGYWRVNLNAGNPAPAAEFVWGPPQLANYSLTLQSYFINGAGADQIFAQFDLFLSNWSFATVESLAFMVFDGMEWHTVETFTNQGGSIPWTSLTFDITEYAAGGLFQIGFKAEGANSFSIDWWRVDNVHIGTDVMSVQPAAIYEALAPDESSTHQIQIQNHLLNPISWEATLMLPIPWASLSQESGIAPGYGAATIDIVFDATGLLPGTYTGEIFFTGAGGLGEQVVPITLEVFDDAFQKIMIPAANSWGYISTYIDLTSKMPLETALADIVEEMIIMLGTDGIFWPGQNINTLGNWDTYKGYKLKMGEEGLLVFFGDPVEDKTVSFPAGTHFIPVLSEFPISVLDVFSGHDIEFAFGLDGSIYWPLGGIVPGVPSALETLYPGYGYLVKFNAPATLDFNVTKSTTLPNVVAQFENSTPWNDVTKTGDIHIVGISGEALEMLQPGDVVGVFNADGLCTGMSMYAEQNQPFAITVYGNDVTTAMRDGMEAGERMHVMVFSNGEVTELDPVYSTRLAASDGNFANSGVSMITGVKSATGIDVEQANTLRIYPNPSDGLFTIQGADASMKVMVMNSHGQVVYQSDRLLSDKLDLSAQPAGIYFIRLIGNDQIRTEKVIIQ